MIRELGSDTLYRVDEEREQLKAAARRFRRAKKVLDDARDDVNAAIVAARRAGISPSEVNQLAPFTPAYVRRLTDAAGIPPAPKGPKPKRGKRDS